MKAKVLMYSKNGNGVVAKHVELENVEECIYLFHSENVYKVIGEIEGVYFFVDNCHNISRLNKEAVKDFIENFIQYVLEDESVFVSSLYLEVFKALGKTDYLPALMEKRERWMKRVREEDEEHERYLQRERELFEEKYNNSVSNYISGEQIYPDMFLEMIARNNIYVHPRTKHTIANNLYALTYRGVWNNGKKKGGTEKVFQAIEELNEKLNIKE